MTTRRKMLNRRTPMLVINHHFFSLSFNSADASSYGIPLPRRSFSCNLPPVSRLTPPTSLPHTSAVAMTTAYAASLTSAVHQELSHSTSLFTHQGRLVFTTSIHTEQLLVWYTNTAPHLRASAQNQLTEPGTTG